MKQSNTIQPEINQNFDAPALVNPLVTPEEVARLLQLPKSWVYTNKHRIPGYVRFGRYVRFRRADIAEFLTSSSKVIC